MKVPDELVQNFSSHKMCQARLSKTFLGVKLEKMQIKHCAQFSACDDASRKQSYLEK